MNPENTSNHLRNKSNPSKSFSVDTITQRPPGPTRGLDFDSMNRILEQDDTLPVDTEVYINEVFCTPPNALDTMSNVTRPDTSTAVMDSSPDPMDIDTDFDLSLAAEMIQRKRDTERKPGPDEVTRYVCALCGNNYKRRSDAHAHVQDRHLNMTNHQCQHCGKKWNRRWVFERHLRNVHGVTKDGASSSSARPQRAASPPITMPPRGTGSESSQNIR